MSKSILLVDDEKDFTELTKTLFGFHGFDIDTFNEPIQVEAQLQKKSYQIIVTDLMMPGLNGFDLIRKIRGLNAYQKTPLIVLSAKILTDEERKFLLQNQVHVISKPFEPNTLVEQVTHLIGKTQ